MPADEHGSAAQLGEAHSSAHLLRHTLGMPDNRGSGVERTRAATSIQIRAPGRQLGNKTSSGSQSVRQMKPDAASVWRRFVVDAQDKFATPSHGKTSQFRPGNVRRAHTFEEHVLRAGSAPQARLRCATSQAASFLVFSAVDGNMGTPIASNTFSASQVLSIAKPYRPSEIPMNALITSGLGSHSSNVL